VRFRWDEIPIGLRNLRVGGQKCIHKGIAVGGFKALHLRNKGAFQKIKQKHRWGGAKSTTEHSES